MADAKAGRFSMVLVWKLDKFGRSVPDCLGKMPELDALRVRWIATSQNLDTDNRNPASRLLLNMRACLAEFERESIRERTQAGRRRYQGDYQAGKVGKTVHSRSGKDLPPHRPRRIFDREEVLALRRQGHSLRAIARRLGIGLGTVARTLQACSKGTAVEKDGVLPFQSGSVE